MFAERLAKTEIGSGLRSSSDSDIASLDMASIAKLERISTKKTVTILDVSQDSDKDSPRQLANHASNLEVSKPDSASTSEITSPEKKAVSDTSALQKDEFVMQIFKKLNPTDESPDPVINYQTSIASTFVSIHE